MKSVMKPQFMAPTVKIPRSKFDRSHGFKAMFNSGYLVPFYADEVLPGDTHNFSAQIMARMTTPIVPFMDNLKLTSFFFFVPLRLLWTNFQKFMGEQVNPGDSISYLVPTVTSPASGFTVGSLFDYLGCPTLGQVATGKTLTMNAFHSRAYNLIYNQWFRDENLQNSVTVDTGNGPDTYINYVLLRRGKRPDYFTTCLTSTQKGAAVTMPLGSFAPVGNLAVNAANSNLLTTYGSPDFNIQPTGLPGEGFVPMSANPVDQTNYTPGYWQMNQWSGGSTKNAPHGSDTFDSNSSSQMTGSGGTPFLSMGVPFGALTADLSSAIGPTINLFRQAIQLQSFLEKDNVGGTRYIEIIQSHFGVISPDARLQRPEYLGGNSSMLRVNPVVQSSATGASGTTTPQGNLAAFALTNSGNHGFSKSFTEHGVILGLLHVGADLSYQQGLERMYSRQTRYDYFWPTLAHLGNQTVYNREIYATDDTSAQDAAAFGYQERYSEYRVKQSQITGLFRSTAATTLDIWHLAQKFTSLPTLGTTFISDTPPVARDLAVTSQPEFYLDCYNKLISARPIPVYGNPAQLSRF